MKYSLGWSLAWVGFRLGGQDEDSLLSSPNLKFVRWCIFLQKESDSIPYYNSTTLATRGSISSDVRCSMDLIVLSLGKSSSCMFRVKFLSQQCKGPSSSGRASFLLGGSFFL